MVLPTGIEPVLQDPQSCVARAPHLTMSSTGIEPVLQDPQSCVLSVELRGQG